ncbi:MAG TPA: prephenate dehydrogenase/arogenate dehydrogenase family protein [Coleofasciculaceae cyanobacterium]|jgi:prephenate dehydrogenase
MANRPFTHLTVFGLGLIGGSLAMAARERFPGLHIQGVDPSAETLQFALKHQIIDKAGLNLSDVEASLQNGESHLVILAAHLPQNLEILQKLAPVALKAPKDQSLLVTDIGSCKRQICDRGRELLPTRFIAGHPMAGREHSGIEAATALLFTGKAYLLCPHEETDSEELERLKTFIQGLGANPRLIDAERHDRYMAYVSHLPQLYSILLTNLLYRHEPGHLLAYHGGGLDDQLRLAASPYPMWGPIFDFNRDNMAQVLTELRDIIDEVIPLLSGEPGENGETLQNWFARSNQIYQQFQALRATRAMQPS